MEYRPKFGQRAISGFAQFVLAVATGLPLRSTERLVPRSDDRNGPYIGI